VHKYQVFVTRNKQLSWRSGSGRPTEITTYVAAAAARCRSRSRRTGSRASTSTLSWMTGRRGTAKDLVTGRDFRLPVGYRASRAPTGKGLAEQIISAFFEIWAAQRRFCRVHSLPSLASTKPAIVQTSTPRTPPKPSDAGGGWTGGDPGGGWTGGGWAGGLRLR
jgi:hypothetical protein